MKICIITGSNGLVGSSSVNFFLRKKFRVIGIDNNLREYFFGKDGSTSWLKKINKKKDNFLHKNVDIRNYKELKKIFRQNKNNIKLVIHTAAQPSHDWAAKEPLTDNSPLWSMENVILSPHVAGLSKGYWDRQANLFMHNLKCYLDNDNNLMHNIVDTNPNSFLI